MPHMTPARSACRQLDLGPPANALAAAPEAQQAASLPVKTARLLMALPPAVRNTLSVARERPESTEQQLTELANPTGSLDTIKAKRERLGEDLKKLRDARDALTANRRFEEVDRIDEPVTLLTECFNLLSHECDIRVAGDTLLNHYRDLGTLLQTAGMSYAEGQQRIHPSPSGGAPHRQRSLANLSDEKIAALDVHLQQALAAPTRDELLSHLASLTFELNRSNLHADRYFLAWFAARAVLESRQLSAPDLLDGEVFRDMQNQLLSAEEIQQTLAQTILLSLDNQAIGQLVVMLGNTPLAGFPETAQIQDCLNCPQLLPLGNSPGPRVGAFDDPAWNLIQTPPASPRA